MTNKATRLRELFFSGKTFVLPGVCDGYEAKLVQAAGFKACYMSGGRTSASRGYPDAGLLTMNEMVANAHYISLAIDIPLLSDCDTGYGNALNVRRAVQEFIMAGAAGVHIEDQVTPKRCGFMPGKQIIAIEEAVGKLRAAVDVRNELEPDFVIIARTDSLGAVDGTLDEAVRRAEAYRRAGTDVTFIEGIKSLKELRFIAERVEKPFMIIPDAIPISERPYAEELEQLGVSAALTPPLIQDFVTSLLWEYLHDVNARGLTAQKEWGEWLSKLPRKYSAAPSFWTICGFPQIKTLEETYLPAKELDKYQKSTGMAWGKQPD
jgi:2-methylisocitrate lyase-like PEP mutase family enzyme